MQSRTYLVIGAIAAVIVLGGIYLYSDGGLRSPSTAEQPMGASPTSSRRRLST